MSNKEILKESGLSDGEATVYLALLKLGEAQVNRIKIETKIHRTTIYDFLDSLKKKGLVSYIIKNNVKFFKANDPSYLNSILEEKRESLFEIIQDLRKLSELKKEPLKIEVYEGVEGFKIMTSRLLEKCKEFMAFGVDESKFEEMFPYILRKYFQKEENLGIIERLITEKGTKFVYKRKNMEYRYIDKKFFSPIPTTIFGNYVSFIIWEPLTIIFIENKDLADAYKKHFELMWRIADKKP